MFFQISSWVTNIGEEFLTVHVNLGTSANAAQEFQEDHEQLMDELRVSRTESMELYLNFVKLCLMFSPSF